MKKIIFSIAFVLFMFSTFCVYSIAAENVGADVKNGIRNVVGGAENVVEDTAKGASDTIKGATKKMEDSTNNAADKMKDTTNNAKNGIENASDNAGYTAQRTATDVTNGQNGFMSSETWSWIIIAVIAIAIIALF